MKSSYYKFYTAIILQLHNEFIFVMLSIGQSFHKITNSFLVNIVWVVACALGESEDAEWIDEDEVDTTGIEIPSSALSSGLPLVENNGQLPWDWMPELSS